MSYKLALCSMWHRFLDWLSCPLVQLFLLVGLFAFQVAALGYSATRHSPTDLEPAFLASGVSHWKLGRFELYRVNPPLPRMVAALPVLLVGCNTDWNRYNNSPGSRSEFPIGEDFLRINGRRSAKLFVYARWAGIPFFLLGGYFAYRWSRDLYGSGAGLLTLFLWTFEPNLLAHAELITPDSACTTFGLIASYLYWRWLRQPTWMLALSTGVALGLAQLTKMTWIILYALWPCFLLCQCLSFRFSRDYRVMFGSVVLVKTLQVIVIFAISIYVVNLGYGFDGSFKRLGEFNFVSKALGGVSEVGVFGNRFRQTTLAFVPVPLPEQYLLGLDCQKKDLEQFGALSYLRGEWKDGGWWYYYLYGLLVKVPLGILSLAAWTISVKVKSLYNGYHQFGSALLLATVLALVVAVSAHLEFNIHLRYVFPALGMGLVYLGKPVSAVSARSTTGSVALATVIAYTMTGTLLSIPNTLSYFNEFAGGAAGGHKHLLGSSLDWGQDLCCVDELVKNGREFVLLVSGTYDPSLVLANSRVLNDVATLAELPEGTLCLVSRNVMRSPRPRVWTGSGATVPLDSTVLVEDSDCQDELRCFSLVWCRLRSGR